jgi:hypothetical protein
MATHSAGRSNRDPAHPGSVNYGWRVPPRALGCIAAAVLLAGAAGCASKGVPANSKAPASEVKIYQTTDLLQSQYTLVQHVWIDSWRSNITYPTFKSEADGVDAMKRAASDAGANGLINVICFDTRSKASQNLSLNCYGDAIRVN